MRFSILLPTRNGGEFLHGAIASALDQNYADMEVVVSDNASDPETREVVSRFASDPRLKYVRLDTLVSVTDNWNHALRVSQGEYAILIGDDDCLLPGFFQTIHEAVERHDHPDCLTFNGFAFMFPRSIVGQDGAWYADRHFRFGPEFVPDAPLPPATRTKLVKDMFGFRVRFPLNMQLTMFSRRVTGKLRGETFWPPFPDHYALSALLLIADRFVYIPDRVVVVGVSPKSFGHYYYGGQQREGTSYLGLDAGAAGRLPGSELLNYMREWLGTLKREYPEALADTAISRWNYAGRQVYHSMRDFEYGRIGPGELFALARLLSVAEQVQFFLPLLAYRAGLRGLRAAGVRRRERFLDMWPSLRPLPGVESISQFVAWLQATGQISGRRISHDVTGRTPMNQSGPL